MKSQFRFPEAQDGCLVMSNTDPKWRKNKQTAMWEISMNQQSPLLWLLFQVSNTNSVLHTEVGTSSSSPPTHRQTPGWWLEQTHAFRLYSSFRCSSYLHRKYHGKLASTCLSTTNYNFLDFRTNVQTAVNHPLAPTQCQHATATHARYVWQQTPALRPHKHWPQQ